MISEEEYKKHMSRIDEIFQSEHGTPEDDELNKLVQLVVEYEEVHCPMSFPDPIAGILFRMDQSGITIEEIISIFGSKEYFEDVMYGRKQLNKETIDKLEEFGVPREVLEQEIVVHLGNDDVDDLKKIFKGMYQKFSKNNP